jgi:hypothetical protein
VTIAGSSFEWRILVENEIDGTKFHETRGHRRAMGCHFCDTRTLGEEQQRILRCRIIKFSEN